MCKNFKSLKEMARNACFMLLSLFFYFKGNILQIFTPISKKRTSIEDPLWSSGHDTRLPNGKAVVQIRGSTNAYEPKRIRTCNHEPTTPGESCGSSTR